MRNEKNIKKLMEEKNALQLALHTIELIESLNNTIALMESLDKIRQRIQEIEAEQ